jgi:ABC-2 type transport system permease protein
VKRMFAIIKKDILLRFNSPVEWLFFFILPVVFILVLSGGTGESIDTRTKLEVVDQAQTDLSASLIDELEESTSVKPALTRLKDAVSDFDSRLVSSILIIPEGFSYETLKEGDAEVEFRQQPNDPDALIASQAVRAAAERISSLVEIADASTMKAEEIGAFTSEDARQAYFDAAFESAQSLMEEAPQRIKTVEGETADSINYDPRVNSTAGQMITWVFIPLIGLSATFAYERERGTLRRLMVTPASKALYIGSTIIGQVFVAAIQMLLLILFGALVLHVDWGDSPLALGLVILSSSLAAAALGTMLGTFVKTSGQANGLSLMLGMAMALMGGCWYPLELFPEVIRNIVKVLPTTWAMQGFLDIAVRGQGVAAVMPETLVLTGFAVVFFVVGIWRFRYE